MASTSPTETQLVQPGSTMESRNHRKLSLRHPEAPTGTKLSDDHEGLCHHDHEHDGLKSRHQHQHQQSNYGMDNSDDHSISIPAASRHAEQTVAPFLAKHIPMQYNPLGQTRERQEQEDQSHQSTSTRFCYRHRPDLKCRRQANEPSMEQLQNVSNTRIWYITEPVTDCPHRNSAPSPSPTSKPSPTSGLSSPRRRRNTAISCSRASLPNAVFHNSPSSRPLSATLSRSTSFQLFHPNSVSRFFATSTPHRCAKQRK